MNHDHRNWIDSELLLDDSDLAIVECTLVKQISNSLNVTKKITDSSKRFERFHIEYSVRPDGALARSLPLYKDHFSSKRYLDWILENSLQSFIGCLPIRESPGLKNNCLINDEAIGISEDVEKQPVKICDVKPRVKRAPARSPYFSSPVRPLKRRKVKTEIKPESKNLFPKIVYSPLTSKPDNELWNQVLESPSRHPPGIVSCIPFPPLSHMYFGLIQEKLVEQPFRLLIAITFLIRTHGKQAIPVYHTLMSRYPTPESLLAGDREDIVSMIRHLGFQNQRARICQEYASIWLENPPARDKRYAVRGYPNHDSGRNVKKGEVLTDSDKREAWEIGHMTSGTYTLDSWRIFCRDKLRGVAVGWNGEGACEGFQPEWMRVIPRDKELRAFLQWMWLKEGFEWNPLTGETDVARTELVVAAIEGRLVWDDENGLRRI